MAAVAIDPRAMDGKALAAFTLHRFGLGPRPGGIDRIASDPRGALLAELRPGAGRIADGTLLTSKAAIGEAAEFRQQRKVAHEERRMQDGARAMTPNGDKPEDSGGKGMIPLPQRIYLAEAKARYEAALKPDIGFAERLVWFWSNHFCVSADKGPTRAVCGAYEREAIRPHILGKFADMLLAAESHPAMLFYLDNARSIGPGSIAGIRRGKGLNENLAREILELHTLGVRTGYTQTDVTNFAKVITGWTIVPPRLSPEHGGEFWFNARMHEPGPQVVVGRSYADEGFAQGRKVLTDLAHHPATAKHIATKLARHFVADEPPPALVNKLSKRFRDTGGDLMEVTKTLVTAPETWAAPRNKLKPPGEWIVAALRAMDLPIRDVRKVVGAQALLGEPLWRPPAPKGFSDDSAAWLDGLAQRLDIANRVGRVVGNLGQEPDDIINTALGPLASAETREAIGRAESRPQALALLLMAPEFQRR